MRKSALWFGGLYFLCEEKEKKKHKTEKKHPNTCMPDDTRCELTGVALTAEAVRAEDGYTYNRRQIEDCFTECEGKGVGITSPIMPVRWGRH